MSQYLLSVHHDGVEDLPTDEAVIATMFADVGAFNEKLKAQGAWVFAGGLHPIESSTTVDATGGEPIVTDGPFAESKVEVRPFQDA